MGLSLRGAAGAPTVNDLRAFRHQLREGPRDGSPSLPVSRRACALERCRRPIARGSPHSLVRRGFVTRSFLERGDVCCAMRSGLISLSWYHAETDDLTPSQSQEPPQETIDRRESS